jgi:hypothetical protein
MSPEQLAPGLGPLPPVRIHCSQLVETALRSALQPQAVPQPAAAPGPASAATAAVAPGLMDKFTQPIHPAGKPKIVFKPSR